MIKIKEIIKNIMQKHKQKHCSHFFKAKELSSRDENGNVTWPCSKCGKVFVEKYGLKILEKGKCDGNWG